MKAIFAFIPLTNTKGYARISIYGVSLKIFAKFEQMAHFNSISNKNETFLYPSVFDIKIDFDKMGSYGWNTWMFDRLINAIVQSVVYSVSFNSRYISDFADSCSNFSQKRDEIVNGMVGDLKEYLASSLRHCDDPSSAVICALIPF